MVKISVSNITSYKQKSGLVKEPACFRLAAFENSPAFSVYDSMLSSVFPHEIAIAVIIAIAKGKTVFSSKHGIYFHHCTCTLYIFTYYSTCNKHFNMLSV